MDDATALSERIARRELSCVELMGDTLDRIGRENPRINAIVSLRDGEELLAEAAERDAELARGERRGWMHGLPHAVKDLEDTAGIRTTLGSPVFADNVPETDSAVVARIRGAGAILIGKTNVPELGYGSQTYNPVFGATRNPYDPSRTAGGSSGGAGAALAAGLVPVADGSDYMGSLRNPAAFCNVHGFRPSLGRVVSPPYESAFEAVIGTHGPMARTPRDLAALLATLVGRHPEVPFSIEEDGAALAAPLDPPDLGGVRIGWLDGLDLGEAWEAMVTIRCFDATWLHELPRAQLKPELLDEAAGAAAVTGPMLFAAQRARTRVATALHALLHENDALALPSAQVFPFSIGTHWPKAIAGRPMPTYHRWMENMVYASLAGLPAASVPAGFTDLGLPMGVQLIGRPRGDRALLELVEACDREWGALPMSEPPPGA